MTRYRHHGWPRPSDWWHARRKPGCWALALMLLVGVLAILAAIFG